MTTLRPGWAESAGKASASQDEQQRSAALGTTQRKAWRRNGDLKRESVLRGAHKRVRPLPALEFPEDE